MSWRFLREANTYTPGDTGLKTAVIASGAASSDAIDVSTFAGGSFQTPAALTNTALTLQVSLDGTVWDTIRNPVDGVALSDWATLALTVAKVYALPPEVFYYRYIRFTLDGNEAAARTFNVFLKS